MKHKTGIVLLAMRSAPYYRMAVNLAASIKAHQPVEGKIACDLPIVLIHDGTHNGIINENRHLFWKTIPFAGQSMPPFYLKTCLYDLSPFEQTLFLDVDSLCIGDLTAYLDRFKDEEWTSIIASRRDGHTAHLTKMLWANVPDLYEFYKIPKDRDFFELNTSAIWWKKGKIAEDIFTLAKHFYAREFFPDFGAYGPKRQVDKNGSGWYPDELAFEVALMHTTYKPNRAFFPIAFRYGEEGRRKKLYWTQENKDFPIFSMAGGTGNTPRHLWETYGKIVPSFCSNAAERLTGKRTGTANYGRGFKIDETEKAANHTPPYRYDGLKPRKRLKAIKDIIKSYETE